MDLTLLPQVEKEILAKLGEGITDIFETIKPLELISYGSPFAFPQIIGQITFPSSLEPSEHEYPMIEATIRETLSYYFPNIEFMGRVIVSTIEYQYIYQFAPLSPESEQKRESLLPLILSNIPSELSDLVLKRLLLRKLNALYFETSVPFIFSSLREIVMTYYPILLEGEQKVAWIFPARKINWYDVLSYLEETPLEPGDRKFYIEQSLHEGGLPHLFELLHKRFNIKPENRSLIQSGLVSHFFNALANNNLSIAALIWVDPIFQQAINDKNAMVKIGTDHEIWDVLLPESLFSSLGDILLPDAPETYKFMLSLPGMDIRMPYLYNPFIAPDGDSISFLKKRLNKIENVSGLERIQTGLLKTIEMVNERFSH